MLLTATTHLVRLEGEDDDVDKCVAHHLFDEKARSEASKELLKLASPMIVMKSVACARSSWIFFSDIVFLESTPGPPLFRVLIEESNLLLKPDEIH